MALRVRIRVGFMSEFIPPLKYLDKLRFHFHFEFEIFEVSPWAWAWILTMDLCF